MQHFAVRFRFLFDAVKPAARIVRMNTRIISGPIALVAIAFIASITSAQTPSPEPSVAPTTVTSPVVSAPATTTASPNEAEMMNPAAELVRKRWKKTTKKQRIEYAQKMVAARNAKLTPEQRSEISRKAAKARWAKKKRTAK